MSQQSNSPKLNSSLQISYKKQSTRVALPTGEGGTNNSTLSITNQANVGPWLNSSSQSSQAGRSGGSRHLSERVNGKDNARLDRTIRSDQDNQLSPTQLTRPLHKSQFESRNGSVKQGRLGQLGEKRSETAKKATKPLVDYESDSDDCEIVESKPAVFQVQPPENQQQNLTSRIPSQSTQLGRVKSLKKKLDADGYPISSYTASKTKVSQSIRPRDLNQFSSTNCEPQEHATSHGLKRKEGPIESINPASTKRVRAESLAEQPEIRKDSSVSQAVDVEAMTKTQQPAIIGTLSPSDRGLLPSEENQRQQKEAKRHSPESSSSSNRDIKATSPLTKQAGKSAHSGDKRQRNDEHLETTAGKRPKTSQIAQSHTLTEPNTLQKKARGSSVLAKRRAAGGRSLLPLGDKSQQPAMPAVLPNGLSRGSQAVDDVRKGDWLAHSPKSVQHAQQSPAGCKTDTPHPRQPPVTVQGDPMTCVVGPSHVPAFDPTSSHRPSTSTRTGSDGIRSESIVPLPAGHIITKPIIDTRDLSATCDGQDIRLGQNENWTLGDVAKDDRLRMAPGLTKEDFRTQLPTTNMDFLQSPLIAFPLTSMPSPTIEQPTADKVAGEKRSRSEQAEDELYEEYEQEFSSNKRQRFNNKFTSTSSSPSFSATDNKKKRSETRKRDIDAANLPTVEAYTSTTNFDPATFNDSDIDAAFEDPEMETTRTPTPAPPTSSNNDNNNNSNQEPPLGEIVPMSSFAYLFNTGYPPFVDPFEYTSEQEISDSIARWDM